MKERKKKKSDKEMVKEKWNKTDAEEPQAE